MLQKYSSRCRPQFQTQSQPICCTYRPPLYDEQGQPYQRGIAVPESVRARAQLCTPYVRIGRSSATCLPGGEESANVGNVGTPGTDAPVEVRTVSASEYAALVATQVLNAASNAENPDARFQQYFPETMPAPLRVVCPERYPNPVAVRDRGCIPQGIFASSESSLST